jgi:hypothetical protein
MELFMSRDPKGQRLHVNETAKADNYNSSLRLGSWSSIKCVALGMTKDATDPPRQDLDTNVKRWMQAALALSALLNDVSGLIRRKGVPYESSINVLSTCFDLDGAETEHAMTNAK